MSNKCKDAVNLFAVALIYTNGTTDGAKRELLERLTDILVDTGIDEAFSQRELLERRLAETWETVDRLESDIRRNRAEYQSALANVGTCLKQERDRNAALLVAAIRGNTDIMDAIYASRKILAIKYVRQHFQFTLSEAKAAVEKIWDEVNPSF